MQFSSSGQNPFFFSVSWIIVQNILTDDKHVISRARLWLDSESFNNRWLLLFFCFEREVHLATWYLWVIRATAMPLLGSFSSPWLRPHCQLTCLLPRYLFWCWTQQNPFHVSGIYIHFIHFFITHFKHLPVPMLNGILDPMMSVSSFYSLFHPSWLPDCLPLSLPLATVCWIKHCCSFSQRILPTTSNAPSLALSNYRWLIQTNSRPESDKCYTLFLFKTNRAQISTDRQIHTEHMRRGVFRRHALFMKRTWRRVHQWSRRCCARYKLRIKNLK